jgi:DNA polymerase
LEWELLEKPNPRVQALRPVRGRSNAVPGDGTEQPRILFVGEGGRAAEEDAQGLPFVGPAGKLLDK